MEINRFQSVARYPEGDANADQRTNLVEYVTPGIGPEKSRVACCRIASRIRVGSFSRWSGGAAERVGGTIGS